MQEVSIESHLSDYHSKNYISDVNITYSDDVFNIKEIEKIAIKHRLRFLPTKYFKNQIPKEAIFKIKESLPSSKDLIGFCGAPWTLACYMIDAGSSKDYAKTRTFLWNNEQVFFKLRPF